jgi:hypothetical protein
MAETAKRYTIPFAKIERVESDLLRIRHNPLDGPMLSRFEYDHSNTLVVDSNGKRDLLIQNTVPLASDIARLLQHCSPAIVAELVRGYRLAKMAGILGDDHDAIPEIEEVYADHDYAVTGQRIYETIKKSQRKPGGCRTL